MLARLRQQWPDGRGVREFVAILQLHQQHPAALIAQAVDQALTLGCVHADGVRLCLQHVLHPAAPPPTALDLRDRPHLAAIGTQPIDMTVYESLLHGDRG
jgi:hypothetical protein